MNPHLPPAPADLKASHARQHREECGTQYYLACLELSQSLWQQDKPAQAILQLNKAFLAEVTTPPWPLPYRALVWFLENRPPDLFIGNPVRHFQHLASRMSGPRSELRSWRAWACFHLTKKALPSDQFPLDETQLREEDLTIPTSSEVINHLPKTDQLHFPSSAL